MKRLLYIFVILITALQFHSCKPDEPIEAGFKDMERQTVYDYVAENDSLYSKFRQILEAGDLAKTMSAYNPNGNDYTLFLPTNQAVDDFISESKLFSSFDDLLKDNKYVSALARYHVVNMGIITNDFPFGALPELNLSGQYLTVGFEIGADSSYYKINNVAPLSIGNIEVSNGYIHVITKMLTPITFTTYEWLEQNPEYSIFLEAVKATGFDEVLSRIIVRDTISLSPVTAFIEPDSVYHKNNIFSFSDLVAKINPSGTDYADPYNEVYNFVGYHVLAGSWFLSDFEEEVTNYSTFGDKPVNVNGDGIDLLINKGKVVKDTIVSEANDTTYTYVDITFYYDLSNVLTQSGAIHFINQVMFPQAASRAEQYFEFYEEPLFSQYREEGGAFIVEDPELLNNITWTGGNDQLLFVKSDDESLTAWGKDYIQMEGDFSISYNLPRIVQGNYELSIRAHAFSSENALVEVFFDGVKVGGLVDLTVGGNSNNPYIQIELGTVNLINYESHVITVRSLIPGFFNWDYVHFKPV